MARFLWWPGLRVWGPRLEADLGIPPAPSPLQGRGAVIRQWALTLLQKGWTPLDVKTSMAQAGWSLTRQNLIASEMQEHNLHDIEGYLFD